MTNVFSTLNDPLDKNKGWLNLVNQMLFSLAYERGVEQLYFSVNINYHLDFGTGDALYDK